MADEVLVERRGAVQVITINRPEAKNALNEAVGFRIERKLAKPEKDAYLSTCTRDQFLAATRGASRP